MAKNEEHTKAYKLAKKYYPTLWSKETLQSLVDAGKLRQDEYDEIVGEN
jgi:hypothetical protein